MNADPKKDRSLTGKLGAIRMAEIIGCSGAHQDKNGKWNPCATPEELDRLSNAAEPQRRKTALSEVEDWQKSRSLKGKKKKKKEWLNLRTRGIYGFENTSDGGIVSSATPSGIGSGIKSDYFSDGEKGVNPFSPRDNDVDVFTDIESARARSRQLGCIGVSRRISKTGRTVWMPCTNMTDYSRLTGSTALGRRHQQESLNRRIRTVLRDDLTKLRRKKSLFEELHDHIDIEQVKEKSIGRRISGISRMTANFDPNAEDGDGDGLVQEQTPFERPATPKPEASLPNESVPVAPKKPTIDEAIAEQNKRIKRKTQIDWARGNRGLYVVRAIVEKHEKDPNSLTENDWKKLDNAFKKFGPGSGRGSRSSRRGMRSERYIGPPDVGGKAMGSIILSRVKEKFRGKPAGERTHYAIAGAPGMGKSTLVEYLQKIGEIPKNDEAAHVDPDFIKQGLRGYAGGRGAGDVHIESANSATRVVDDAVTEGMDVITEGTGQRMRYYRSIRDRGYNNVGHWAYTPPSTAIDRLRARKAQDKRTISEHITPDVHRATYGLVTGYLKDGTLQEFHLWDTDVPKDSAPKKIAEVVKGVLTVHDKDKFVSWADGGLGRSGIDNLSYWQKNFAKKQ